VWPDVFNRPSVPQAGCTKSSKVEATFSKNEHEQFRVRRNGTSGKSFLEALHKQSVARGQSLLDKVDSRESRSAKDSIESCTA